MRAICLELIQPLAHVDSHQIVTTSVDLLRLVEEAVDGCWVGYRARTAIMGDSGIGSVYSPPKEENCDSPVVTKHRHVETIIDIGYRKEVHSLVVDWFCSKKLKSVIL